MEEKEPFTFAEEEVMRLLVEAHNKFIQLPRKDGHPNELTDWVTNFHALQNTIIYRVVKRDYPKYFK